MEESKINVKATEDMLKGVYANLLVITHSKEEYLLDFMTVVGGEGSLVARVFMSPGHLKRTIKALEENLSKYEQKFGAIIEAEELK